MMEMRMVEKLLSAARRILTPAQVCWICLFSTGGLYTYAVQSFASVTDVRELHIKFSESSIFDLRVKHCEAVRRGQSGAAYRAQIQELMREYRERTGADFVLPQCNEL